MSHSSFLLLLYVVLLLLGASSPFHVDGATTICPCCCPEMAITPELHTPVDQILGANSPNFSASFFTGQQQLVLESSSLITVLAEISVRGVHASAFPVPHVPGDAEPKAGAASTSPASSSSTAGGQATGNCSWSDRTGERCAVTACLSQWQTNDVQWRFSSLQGHISDILSTGLRTIAPTVQMEVDSAADSFLQRMSQSSKVRLGAVYRVESAAVCAGAVTDLECFASHYWYLPYSGIAFVSDLTIPIGSSAQAVVEQRLPLCDTLQARLKRRGSSALDATSTAESVNANLTAGLASTGSRIDAWVLAETPNFDYATALSRSRPDRVLCVNSPIEAGGSTRSGGSSSSSSGSDSDAAVIVVSSSSSGGSVSASRYGAAIVAVVPIVRSSRDVVFTKDVEVRACVSFAVRTETGTSSAASSCGMRFIQGGAKCGAHRVAFSRSYSLLLTACAWMGLAVAIVSSLALLFGASAIMIAIDAQLLAVIAQGSCSSSVSRPATVFLQQFLFLGRAAEDEDTSSGFYSSIVGWLVGVVSVSVFVHGMLVVLVSVIWRTLLKRAKAKPQQQQQQRAAAAAVSPSRSPTTTALHNASAPPPLSLGAGKDAPGSVAAAAEVSAAPAPSLEPQLSFFESILMTLNVNSASAGASVQSAAAVTSSSSPAGGGGATANTPMAASAETVIATSNQAGTIRNDQIAAGFLLEERRILARTAAALRFPSASLIVLLVALQGLWFAAVNVWWYSTTPVESMPGIIGCLFALLLTLIILVLARQTRLIFTPYSWLHPEQAMVDAREAGRQLSEQLARRSLRFITKSWYFPYGAWGPARPRQRMGTLFLPVKARGWIGVPFLVSLCTCLTVCIYPVTVLGCCAQQMFLSLFFFAVALVVWKSQPMRSPYANDLFVAVRGALSVLCFARTVVLVTEDAYFDAAHFLLIFLVQALILFVGAVDIWCGLAEHAVWLPHLDYRQNAIRARTGGALRQQRLQEEEAALEGADDDEDEDDAGEEGGAATAAQDRQSRRGGEDENTSGFDMFLPVPLDASLEQLQQDLNEPEYEMNDI